MSKGVGGSIVLLAGIVFVIGAVKGTWRDIFDAALAKSKSGGNPGGIAPNAPGAPVPNGQGGYRMPSSDTGGYCTDPNTGFKIPCPPGVTPGNEVGPIIGATSGVYAPAGWPGSGVPTVG
jgi:hypothetical protein